MELTNKKGWISIYFSISLLIIIALLGLTFSSQLKMYHEMKLDKICRNEQSEIFFFARKNISFIFDLNPLASNLYLLQTMLLPIIWHPAVAEFYTTLLKLRINFEKIQNSIITGSKIFLTTKAFILYQKLVTTNLIFKRKLHGMYDYKYQIYPPGELQLAIEKKFKYIFPPYKTISRFSENQKLKIKIFSTGLSKNIYLFSSFESWKNCSASLEERNGPFKIIYDKKNPYSLNSW